MKRVGRLFESVVAFDNIYCAARQAQKRKRYKADVARFNLNLESELLQLQRELQQGSWRSGPYHEFTVYEPKQRLISAAPYRDRVVHHALCQVVEPVFERIFIYDSYANRVGKGTHRALDRCTHFVRGHAYALKADIQKYFHSIDHEILLALLAAKIKDSAVLRLLEKIIRSAQHSPETVYYFPGDDLLTPLHHRKGIPIGNLTSQLFANVYLNGLDHYIKRELKCPAYIRFCDDFVVFHDDKQALHAMKRAIQDYLTSLRLVLHPRKTQVFPVIQGVPFLGFKVYAQHRTLNPETAKRFRKRLRQLQHDYQRGEIGLSRVSASVRSWANHAAFGDTYHLRQSVLSGRVFTRS